MEVYKILEYKDGIIEAENLSGSATFDVTFSCRLCRPLRKTQIICKVNRVNKVLITVENGPILIIITNDRINSQVFFADNNNVMRYKKDGTSHILKPNEFVKVTILSTAFNHKDDIIKAIGFLENIATEDEINQYYQNLYEDDTNLIDFKEYKNTIEED